MNLDDLKRAIDENVAPPNEAGSNRTKYVLGATSKRLIMDRRHLSISPNEGGNLTAIAANSNPEINFYLTGNVYVDTHTVVLRGECKLSADGYTIDPYAGAFAFIDRITLRSIDGADIETIDGAALLARLIHVMSCNKDYLETTAGVWRGGLKTKANDTFVTNYDAAAAANKFVASASGILNRAAVASSAAGIYSAQADAYNSAIKNSLLIHGKDYFTATWWNAVTAKPFEIPLFHILGLFKQTKYLPLQALQRLQLNIRFSDPRTVWTQIGGGGAAIPSYTLSNLKLDYQTVRLHDLLNQKIMEKVASDGLRIDYQTWNYTKVPINTSTASIQIQKGCSDALSCFCVFTNGGYRESGGAAELVDTEGKVRMFENKTINGAPFEFVTGTCPVSEGKTNWQDTVDNVTRCPCPEFYYQIGSEKIPDDPIKTFNRAFRYLQEALGRYGDISYAPMSIDLFGQRYFIMAVNFENDEASLSGMQYTGRSLYSGNGLTLQVTGLGDPAGGAGAFNLQAHAYLLHTKILVIKKNGVETQQ